MSLEDRVVTTATLRDFADDESGTLAVAAGLLQRLPEDGLHMLVPRGRAPVPGEVLWCEAQLDIGEQLPARVPVLVPRDLWSRLPTGFAIVSAAGRLVPAVMDDADLGEPLPLEGASPIVSDLDPAMLAELLFPEQADELDE